MDTKNIAYSVVMDKILAELDKGVIPWRRSWKGSKPFNAITKKFYRGINLFLLMSDFSDPRWLTFKQVQELKGTVKKGSKSTGIVFWQMKKVIEALQDRRAWLLLKLAGWTGTTDCAAYHGVRKESAALAVAINLAETELTRRHIQIMEDSAQREAEREIA